MIRVQISRPSFVICSYGPWNPNPPVQRFGQGNPRKLNRAPSVPLEIGAVTGFSPTFLMLALRYLTVRDSFGKPPPCFHIDLSSVSLTVPFPYFSLINFSISFK